MQHDLGNLKAVALSVAADWVEAAYRYPLRRELELRAAQDIIEATLSGDDETLTTHLALSSDHARVMRRIKPDLPRLCSDVYTTYHEVQEGFA